MTITNVSNLGAIGFDVEREDPYGNRIVSQFAFIGEGVYMSIFSGGRWSALIKVEEPSRFGPLPSPHVFTPTNAEVGRRWVNEFVRQIEVRERAVARHPHTLAQRRADPGLTDCYDEYQSEEER